MLQYALIRFCFLLENLRGHSYDGKGNVSYRLPGVQTSLICQEQQMTYYTYFTANRVNLVA